MQTFGKFKPPFPKVFARVGMVLLLAGVACGAAATPTPAPTSAPKAALSLLKRAAREQAVDWGQNGSVSFVPENRLGASKSLVSRYDQGRSPGISRLKATLPSIQSC